MKEDFNKEVGEITEESSNLKNLKEITYIAKKIGAKTVSSFDDNILNTDEKSGFKPINIEEKIEEDVKSNFSSTKFKVCTNDLPVKISPWMKLKKLMLTEIKVELTPYQQKIEDEINEFLHQEITWNSVKKFFKFGK